MFKKILLAIFLLFIAVVIYVYYKYNLVQYFSFESIKYHKLLIIDLYEKHKWQFIVIFIIAYTFSNFFIIPLFYLVLNVIAGFIFGITTGLVIASIVNLYCTIITFLAARFLFRHYIERKFRKPLFKVNRQLKENGILYVFFIRVFPIMPFVLSNTLMGLTRMHFWAYVIISQISIIPELLLTLYIGKKLDELSSFKEVLNLKNYIIIITLVAVFAILYWLLNKKITKKSTNKTNLPE